MGFTRMDVCKTVALCETRDELNKRIEGLDEIRSTLHGAEKGKVTRSITGYEDQIAQIREALEDLPAQPIEPDEAFATLMGECTRIKETFERAKAAFLDRAVVNPKNALEFAADPVVRAQLHWELVAPASRAEDYDELVQRLRLADEDNDDRLLNGGSPATSTCMFMNAVSLAEHTARQGARRWGPKHILLYADQIFEPRVASWKLLHGEGEEQE